MGGPSLSSMKEGSPLGNGLVQSAEASNVFSSSRHQDPKGFSESDAGKSWAFNFLVLNRLIVDKNLQVNNI